MFGLFVRVLEKGKFCATRWWNSLRRSESVVDGFSFDLYTGIFSWVEIREVVTLRNTSCYKSTSNPKSPGNSNVNGNLKNYDVYRQVRKRDEMNALSSGSQGIVVFFFKNMQ